MRNRFGLEEKRELAPTIALEEYPFWERTDDWGSGGQLCTDDRTLLQRLSIPSFRDLVIALFLWHFIIAEIAFSKLSSAWQKATSQILIGVILTPVLLMEIFEYNFQISNGDTLLVVLGWAYVAFPAVLLIGKGLMYKDELPKPRK